MNDYLLPKIRANPAACSVASEPRTGGTMLRRSCPPRLRLQLRSPRGSRASQLLLAPSRVLCTGSTTVLAIALDRKSQTLTNTSSSRTPSTTTMAGQLRFHSGHSHSHSHHHDNTYLTSTNKNDAGVRITRIGLYVNLGMAISKGFGGYVFNSQALIADAFHALTDLVSDFMTLATISIALRPPTEKYPNGFGKVESFGSLVVSGLLLAGGLLMGQHSCAALITQFWPEFMHLFGHSHGILGHSHDHSAAALIPNLNAAWLAGGSIIIKEYLYRASQLSFPFYRNTQTNYSHSHESRQRA
jgi:hypothetical protein